MNDLVTKYTMKTGNNWGTGILILNKKNETLIGLRTDTKEWATPGGKVEIGETAEKGILREVKEETNLSIKNPEFIDVVVRPFNNAKVWATFLFVKRNVYGDTKPQLSEFSELKWVPIDKLEELNLFEPTELLLEVLKQKKIL